MTTKMLVIGGLVVVAVAALAIAYARLERHPIYGAYYGLAKLLGGPLDVGPVDFARLTRHATGNDALICPPGLCAEAEPDGEAKVYDVTLDRLLERVRTIALAEPDTEMLECDVGCAHVARFVQRTRVMRFPDTIDVEVYAAGTGKSTLAIYSRSLVGRRDFGVNRARVVRWLAELDRQL
jgi:uncharacterized protein (DUF1499 family)